MDSSNHHDSISITTSSNGENEKKVSTMIQSKHAEFLETYEHQDFSLPDSIMFYVAKNPSSHELYEKMVQTCKDFFVKNPILVIPDLIYESGKWHVNRKLFDLDNLTSKLWIRSQFVVHPTNSIKNNAVNESIISSIIPKLFRCDIKSLILDDHILSFDDLCLLLSTAEKIFFRNVSVRENDGSNVGIEKIFEVSVKAKKIKICAPPITSVTSKTMKELIKIPHFSKLDWLSLTYIPETFDIEAFYVYMKKNQQTHFNLEFDDSISAAYKNRLDEIVDEIIATETLDYKPPRIDFPGMSEEKEDKLYRICFNL